MMEPGQGPGPDERYVPPASTRWSDHDGDPEPAELIPPFVPGASPSMPPDATEDAATDAAPEAFEEAAVHDAGPDPEPTYEEPAYERPAYEGPVDEEPLDEEPFPFEVPWSQESDAEEPMEVEDDFPVEAFSIEQEEEWIAAGDPAAGDLPGGADPGAALPMPEPADEPAPVAAEPDPGDDAVGDVADRLEFLASRLRADGAEGIERELASADRLTSLVAALVAGHLASR